MANEPLPPEIERKVKGPAIGLIVTGVLGGLGALADVVVSLAFPELARQGQEGLDPRVLQFMEAGGYAFTVVWLAGSVFIVLAGLQMLRLKSWLFALLGNVAAIIPCFGCCCIGLPVGIWGFIVLQDEKVKAAFKT